MPILYIMCGLPFSGKTYISKKISDRFSISRISYDELWKEINQKESRDPSWEELCLVAENQISTELKAGHSLVYDTLNDTVRNREKLRKVAQDAGGHAIVIYTKTPKEIIEQRRTENISSGERHDVDEKNFNESFERFEEPIEGEDVIIRTPDQNVDQWLDDLKNFIK